MILVDYSATALSGILNFEADLQRGEPGKIADLMRHVVLNTIVSYKKKYGKEYGEITLCADSRNYWRRGAFPEYKAHRKKSREESTLDWKLIFDIMSQVRDEIDAIFPYHVVNADGAEGDDCVAVLCEFLQNEELVNTGLYEEPQPILIMSADGDYKQLHKFQNVKQISTQTKKLVKESATSIRAGLIEKIVRGDPGDGIPNIRSADNHFTDNLGRQQPITAKRIEEFLAKGIDACQNEEERKRYKRNELLISFDHIPQWVRENIIAEYKKPKVKMDRMALLSYLQKNRLRQLINSLEDF